MIESLKGLPGKALKASRNTSGNLSDKHKDADETWAHYQQYRSPSDTGNSGLSVTNVVLKFRV